MQICNIILILEIWFITFFTFNVMTENIAQLHDNFDNVSMRKDTLHHLLFLAIAWYNSQNPYLRLLLYV